MLRQPCQPNGNTVFAEIAICRARAGAVVSKIAVVIPQFDLIGIRAFDLGGDFLVGGTETADRTNGKILFAASKSGGAGKVFEDRVGD